MSQNDLIHQHRQFLKADLWKNWQGTETDQKKGVPVPPVEKPIPPGAVLIDLPGPQHLPAGQVSLAEVIRRRRSLREYAPEPLSLEELSFLLWACQGVSRDEQGKPQRRIVSVLRTVPSGGARHPFETYLVVNRVSGLEGGLYRYLPLEHQLCRVYNRSELDRLLAAHEPQQDFTLQCAVLFIWTANPYRTEWRYGIVAARLIALDAGHVCQNLYLASEAIGAGTCAIGAYDQEGADGLLGLDGKDEFTIYMAAVGKR